MDQQSAQMIASAIRDLSGNIQGIGLGLFGIAFVLFVRMIFCGK